jgi:hypothetical protein
MGLSASSIFQAFSQQNGEKEEKKYLRWNRRRGKERPIQRQFFLYPGSWDGAIKKVKAAVRLFSLMNQMAEKEGLISRAFLFALLPSLIIFSFFLYLETPGMNSLLTIGSVLALGVGLSAQVATSGMTKTVIGNTAMVGKTSSYRFIKANVPFSHFARVTAAVRGASMGTSATISSFRGRTSIRVSEGARASSFSSSTKAEARTSKGTDITKEPHVFSFKLTSKKTVKGKLLVSLGGRGTKGAVASIVIRVGRSIISWKQGMPSVRKTLSVSVGSAGLVISSTSMAKASVSGRGSSSISAVASILFEPGAPDARCKLTPYGRSCALLTGTVKDTPAGSLLELTTTRGLPRALGFTVAGSRKVNIRFPGTSCFLLTDVQLVIGLYHTDSRGTGKHVLLVPRNYKGSFNLQDILIQFGRTTKVSSSNGLVVTCK